MSPAQIRSGQRLTSANCALFDAAQPPIPKQIMIVKAIKTFIALPQ
jgi:hypothetical protein